MWGGRSLPRSRPHRLLTYAALLLCGVLAARGVAKGLRPGGNDFTIYYESARAVLERRDPLAIPGSIYPPSFDVLIAPLGWFPYGVAHALWNALGLFGLLWGWRRSLQMLREALEAEGATLAARPWLPWFSLLAVSRLADSTFAYGQVNTLTFALLAEAAFRVRRRQDGRAAQALAMGTAAKLLPLGLCGWAWMRGSRRAVLLALFSSAAWIAIPPFAVLGPELARASFRRWSAEVVAPVLAGGHALFAAREYLPGQSLQAACYRTFSATPATSEGRAGPRANLFDWPLERTHRLIVGLSLLQFGAWLATLARLRRAPVPGAERRDLLALALTVTTILSLAPVVQKAHMVWLLLPYVVLFGLPSGLRGTPRVAREILSWTSVALVALTAPALLGDALATRLLSQNVVFAGLECAWLALAVDAWCETRGSSQV